MPLPEIVGLPKPPRADPSLRRVAARERLLRATPATALALGSLLALGLAQGGFFPRTWSWATVGLATTTAAVLVLRRDVVLSRRPLVLLGLLAALGLWLAASLCWTRSVALTVPELQRLLVYVGGVALATVLVRTSAARALLTGVFLGTAGITLLGLLSYLSSRDTPPDVFEGSYLHWPLGYANSVAITSVIALLIGLGIATDSPIRRVRVAVTVTLVPLASALALTGSRAGWAALAVGAGVAVALTPERARTLGAWVPIALVPTVAALVVSASDVTSSRIVGEPAAQLGDRVLVLIVALSAIALGPALVATRPRGRQRLGSRRRLVWALAALAALAIALAAVEGPPGLGGDRPAFWRVAAAEFAEHPLLGSGAGSYAQVWLERRPSDDSARDAHSVVVEALAEVGPLGALLVCALLALPVFWALRARARPLVPCAAGAWAAYAAHASVDWDWELPAVTLAALFCAVSIGLLADSDRRGIRLAVGARYAALALSGVVAAVALAGLIGATALDHAGRSLARGDLTGAKHAAASAARWQPWSVEPLLVRGRAHLGLGAPSAARADFARAAARDPNDYRAWLALAAVSSGRAAHLAVARAQALNPRAVHDTSGKEEQCDQDGAGSCASGKRP